MVIPLFLYYAIHFTGQMAKMCEAIANKSQKVQKKRPFGRSFHITAYFGSPLFFSSPPIWERL